MMRSLLTLLAACGLLLLAGSAGAAENSVDWPGRAGRYVFEITRDGKPIGTQIVSVQQNGETVIAITESKIAVEMLGITVYRMHQVLTETYQGKRLMRLKAETKDPDGLRAGEITRDGDHWTGKMGKQRRAFDCDCMTSTMWHIGSMTGTTMIEASQARTRAITIEDKGPEILDLPEGKVETHHFLVKGEIERDVWYDQTGNLVSARQTGSDGSVIRQTLMSDPTASRETGDEASQP